MLYVIIVLYLSFVKIELLYFPSLLISFKVRCLDLVCAILFDTLVIFFVGMLLCFLLMCVFEFGFFDDLECCCFVGMLV